MPSLIQSITDTRILAGKILSEALRDIDGLSETEIKDKIFKNISRRKQLFPQGWYSPPPDGIVVLLAEKPFSRLLYDSNRKKDYWPQKKFACGNETVGNIYISPVNKTTGMFGDMGLTFYRGNNEKIKRHLKNSFSAILKIAEYTRVGMKFSEICEFAFKTYKNKLKPTFWLTTSSDPNHKLNLGHTVPGSFEKKFNCGGFEQIKEVIKNNRVYINDNVHFIIPETCAFTIESRIEDCNDASLPSVFFHFIVCFEQGKKNILQNFDGVFNAIGMDYIL